jgi:3-hydroxy-3-methylglutaryl CoA synthase
MHPERAAGRPPVGIERIRAYPCSLYLDLEELARARGHDPADLRDNLLVRTRSLNPLFEDPVTMAVNAARPMLTDEDRAAIELLVVATESSVDQGKPISTFAQRHLGIQPNCRNYEAKHACYGGTSALMMAAHWVASGISPGKKALVIATDQSRMHLGKAYEYVMGASAVAMLVSTEPRVAELELEHNGYWTQEVSDTFRPTSRDETGNGEASLYCYLDALEGAYAHYLSKAGPVDFEAHFKKNLYHVPFGGLTFQAHRTLLGHGRSVKKSEAWRHFEERSKPGLKYNTLLGGTYSGSTFIALMGLIEACEDLRGGDRIGIFSYGSGSCGEFYSAILGSEAREIVAQARLGELVEARDRVSVPEYEALEAARFAAIDLKDDVPGTTGLSGLYERRYAGQGLLVYRGVKDFYREYGWS